MQTNEGKAAEGNSRELLSSPLFQSAGFYL